MSNTEKAILGALGGLSAVLVKFLGQDYANVVAHVSNLTAEQLLSYKVGYGILTPILMFLGGFVAWLSDEQKRIKIVALAIAAPAMITTWSGGQKGDSMAALDSILVPSAYAESIDKSLPMLAQSEANTAADVSTLKQIQRGIGVFFGFDKQPKTYWVIVGSFKKKEDAQQFAEKVNNEDKTLNAWVGIQIPGNDYYPVIVGSKVYLSEANKLKQRALATEAVNDVYFSTGERK